MDMERVVSLLPSTTEILFALGAEDRLVGISHECDFPTGTERITSVTSSIIGPETPGNEIDALVRAQLDEYGTLYTLDLDRVRSLHPDLVLTQQLCTVCAVGYKSVRDAFLTIDPPPHIESIEPRSVEEIFASIIRVADLLRLHDRGVEVVEALRRRYEAIVPAAPTRVLFLEWIDPPFCAGHWVPELIERAGGIPLLARVGEHSVGIAWEVIEDLEYDALVLSCCGFSLARLIPEARNNTPLSELVRTRPERRVVLFDGNHYFSRPGPRVVESAELLASALKGIDARDVEASIPEPYVIGGPALFD